MRRCIVLSAILVIATAYQTPAQAQSGRPDDALAAVEANHRKFVAAFDKGDAAAVAALHAADAQLLPENGRPVTGAEDVRAYWHGLLKAGARLVQLEALLRVKGGGRMAYEVGAYVMTVQTGPGQTAVHSGNYAVAWRREGEQWLAAAVTWNKSKVALGQ